MAHGGGSGTRELREDEELVRGALAVLELNSLGHATKPSPRLYPHQWSWDAACIAIGYSHVDQARAERELLSLFKGQWGNGLLPHIVFSEGGSYFPGPEFWETERSPHAPERPRTSGIVQPPVHAIAALAVLRNAMDRDHALAFLREIQPKLAAWHEYLYRERTRDDVALVEAWHPWESGMDNSPRWDFAYANVVPRADLLTRRRDLSTWPTGASARRTRSTGGTCGWCARCGRSATTTPRSGRPSTSG